MRYPTLGRKIGVLAGAWGLAACQAPGTAIQQAWAELPAREGAPHAVALVLYAQDGFVRDARQVDLQAGEQLLRFSGVAPRAQETGALLEIPATVGRRRFRYDLESREKLLQRYDGQTVTLQGATESWQATLLWTPQGPIYRIGDRLFVDPPGKVALPILEPLATEPTFEWVLEAPSSWSGVATATYPVSGLGWRSEYTLVTNAAQGQGSWQHWAEVENRSGIGYRDAQLTLIAGQVRRGHEPPVPMAAMRGLGGGEASPQAFAARYQYRLAQPITLEREATQRLPLSSATMIPIQRTYRFEEGLGVYPLAEMPPRKARIRLAIAHTRASGPTDPLPAGKVLVYSPNPQGELALVGEVAIPDSPLDQEVLLDLGEAFDLTATRTQTRYASLATSTELGYRLVLRNQQNEPVEVEVIEHVPGDWTVLSASHPYERIAADTLRFRPTLPAQGEVTLSYEVRVVKEHP